MLKKILWPLLGLLGGAAYAFAGNVCGLMLLSGAGHSRSGDTAFFLFYFEDPPFGDWVRNSIYLWPLIGVLLPFTRNNYIRCLIALLLFAHYVSITLFCPEPLAIMSYFYESAIVALWTALYFCGQSIILYCLFRKHPAKVEPTAQ